MARIRATVACCSSISGLTTIYDNVGSMCFLMYDSYDFTIIGKRYTRNEGRDVYYCVLNAVDRSF